MKPVWITQENIIIYKHRKTKKKLIKEAIGILRIIQHDRFLVKNAEVKRRFARQRHEERSYFTRFQFYTRILVRHSQSGEKCMTRSESKRRRNTAERSETHATLRRRFCSTAVWITISRHTRRYRVRSVNSPRFTRGGKQRRRRKNRSRYFLIFLSFFFLQRDVKRYRWYHWIMRDREVSSEFLREIWLHELILECYRYWIIQYCYWQQ